MGFWSAAQGAWSSVSGAVHTGLDVAGMIPVVGNAADLVNAGIYAAEGDVINAGVSLAGALPGGQAATGARLAMKGGKEVVEQVAKKGAKAGKEAIEQGTKKGVKEAAEKNVGTKVSKSPKKGSKSDGSSTKKKKKSDKDKKEGGDDGSPDGKSEADFAVTEEGVAIPKDPDQLKDGLSKLDDVSTSPDKSRKFTRQDEHGPIRVRIEKAHPPDPNFTGTPDPLHTVDHIHIERRTNGATGGWKTKDKIQYDWPF